MSNTLTINKSKYLEEILINLKQKNQNQPEFIQAAQEILKSAEPVILKREKEYRQLGLLERLIEPERVITFRVPWVDDNGRVQVNRGYRVQFNSAIGPYKGGLRFHESVNLSVMKFLAFEQVFKNALTGLPMGGAKGGSDFDPKGKSDNEIMRFCQSFMNELQMHIGSNVDIPAGDIGVGAREIGYLFGQYKKVKGAFEAGALTGKGLEYGGSLARKEATGHGLIYFMREMLQDNKLDLRGKTAVISGSGNVAIYALEKAVEYGVKVIAMSDSNGCIYDKNGIDIETIKLIKENLRGRIKTYTQHISSAEYYENGDIVPPLYRIKADIVLPCATQNDINLECAKVIFKNGTIAVGEGANMPTTTEAVNYLIENGVLFAPAKAANAGGVATSCLEMAQNSMRYFWSYKEVDQKLDVIMTKIYSRCKEAAYEYGLENNICAGANISSFRKVARAMRAQGIV
ncbi:MAG: NADP-specific glutamate dehydrogenase [Candidatus Gastranaerophilales bacterium]|nr:NADP-specific glutamate dehydrogenase [Candidatus Gastranaerophilales bacterium]